MVVLSLVALQVVSIALLGVHFRRLHNASRREVAQLRRELKSARRLVQQHGKLAGHLAHDIKNPITAILCSAEALKLLIGDSLSEPNRKALCYIKEYAGSLLHLLGDFLDMQRAEAGEIAPRLESTKLLPELRAALGMESAEVVNKHLVVGMDNISPALLVMVAPKHMRQICVNLVHSAVCCASVGSALRISVVDGKSVVHLSLVFNANAISEADLEMLCDPYVCSEKHPAGFEVEVALSMARCKQLLELYGGSIVVGREASQAVAFCATLPVAVHATSSSTLISEESTIIPVCPRPLQGQSFLVVHEDAGTRESIARLIAAWGGMVDQVSVAADAVEAIARKSYDAVMIDGCTDGVSAHELARIIKDDLHEETRIILASDSASSDVLSDEEHVDQYVEKPIGGDALLHSLMHPGRGVITH